MSNAPKRIVVDTNTLISHALIAGSIPDQAVRCAIRRGKLLASEETLHELADLLSRAKFDPYLSVEERQAFFKTFLTIADTATILRRFEACRDPKDGKFLDVAVNGQAELIITGDKDLLALNPFMRVKIMSARDFLGLCEEA